MPRFIPLLSSLFILSACNATLTPEQQAEVEKLSACDKINALVKGYSNEFNGLKSQKVTNKYADIWQAKYQLVGDRCQISQFSGQQLAYQCQKGFNNQVDALENYKEAVAFTQACLSPDNWKMEQVSNGQSVRTNFHLENFPIISIHSGKTLAKMNNTWSTSFQVGAQPTSYAK
ncbi:hypothetical protein [Pseudoalteromonas ulvae]|uniref:Orphan lipoprotein n=1 Tax=Pseudoalteromonas ulvae TaxID=107327 RepID=A0A244CRA3_PSEDV|nr:hypothetical protein [Pseudoalteromonas ulvae]OUL58125.1 hypothetical protein B1199_07155 [Pseudoalteromonas ulvae]